MRPCSPWPWLPYAVAVVCFLALDGTWLTAGGQSGRFLAMAEGLGGSASSRGWPMWKIALCALAAYGLLCLALCLFGVAPAREEDCSGPPGLLRGALLGLIIYGTFDFTNLAVLGPGYGVPLALGDVAWGTFAMGAATWLGARM